MQCKTANVAKIMTWGFTGEDSAEKWFPPCCWLQHNANTDRHWSSVLQRISPVERNIARWNRRLDWNAWLWHMNLIWTVFKTKFENSHIFLSKYLLEIWMQTIFVVKLSQRDPTLFQQFCGVFNVALRWMANTAAAVIVHSQIQFFFKSNYLYLKWSLFPGVSNSDFKLAIDQSHPAWQLQNWSYVTYR